jgi:signal transduction histidine kinase
MDKKRNIRTARPLTSYLVLAGFIVLTLFVTALLYTQIQTLFRQRLQERLVSMASTAAVHLDAETLAKIEGADSVDSPEYKKVVIELNKLRAANRDIKYIYILRKTDDPNIFEFVADADSLDPSAEVDLNGDGVIDESDALNWPGDEYDVSEFGELRDFGFLRATVDSELAIDQWGKFLSSSAPIFGKSGSAQELIGIDVEVTDYIRIINLALFPYLLFVGFLLLVLIALTVFLVEIWGSRVNALNELDRQKDELIGIVSHQLAKPITAIKWNLELLLDGDIGVLAKEQQETLRSMQDVAHHLTGLVDMILDVSRIQLGRINLEAQPLDLEQFFREIIQVIEPGSKERKQNFIKNIPTKMPTVLLDKKYLRMTVENLLSNAVKYTPEKGTVELNVQFTEGRMLCSVKDTGCGIPKADQAKIFGKLYRASNVRNTVDGNGFGLYVAKGAIEGQGGQMWFESEEGKGTTFYFELPLKYPPVSKTQAN